MINEAKFAHELFAKGHTQYMSLQIFVDSDDLTLIHKYNDAIKKHNSDILAHDTFNSGFDLFSLVEHIELNPFTLTFDFKVACKSEIIHDNFKRHPCGFYLYPRSSIGKTQFRLANSVGIIDSSYRGNIMAKIRNFGEDDEVAKRGDKLFQICAPDLKPVVVQIVTELSETSRGSGGFGSTTK